MANTSLRNPEAWFNEIIKTPNEYSTDNIQDWNLIKPDILYILQIHLPIKIEDYEYGLSAALKENQRLIVREFEDKSLVREYGCTNKCSKCCDCSTKGFIEKYGIIFIKSVHTCKPRKYSVVMKNQERLKEQKLNQHLVQNEETLKNENLNPEIVLHERHENYTNEQSIFEEIFKSPNAYSTEKIEDWNLLKSDILNILKTHRPIKLGDYEHGLSSNLKENHRLIIHEFKNRNFVREYSTHAKKGNFCCGCFSTRFIEKYGIIFVKNQHKCKPRQYSAVMKNQEKLKQKLLLQGSVNEATVVNENLNTGIVLHEHHKNDKNEQSVFEEIMKSSDEYSTDNIQDWNLLKSDILNILKTHRPIKIADYELGISAHLKENGRLIIHEFGDKNLVREYSRIIKKGSFCCDCHSTSVIEKYGIIFVKDEHYCKPREYSAAIKNQEKLKQKMLIQVPQSELEKSTVLRRRRPNNISKESAFDEILNSQKEFTERNIDFNSIKEEILELLKTYRPLKISEYQIQMSKKNVFDHRIHVLDKNDKSVLHEYRKTGINDEWRCYKCECFSDRLIIKYGIAFIPWYHDSQSKKTSTANPFLKDNNSMENQKADNQILPYDANSEYVYNKIINSTERYTVEQITALDGQQIKAILKTHRPIKLTHYKLRLSQKFEENHHLIVYQNEQKTRIREYTKHGDIWICDGCINLKGEKQKCLNVISGIVFLPKINKCSIQDAHLVRQFQKQLKARKTTETGSMRNNVINNDDGNISPIPVLDGPFLNSHQNSESPTISNMENNISKKRQNKIISSNENLSQYSSILQTEDISSPVSEAYGHNVNHNIDTTIENVNDVTSMIEDESSITDLTFPSILESNISANNDDEIVENQNTTNSTTLKRKIKNNVEDINDEDETRIFIDEKPPNSKKAKVENVQEVQETPTTFNNVNEQDDDCIIIDKKHEIRQISMNEHFEAPFAFEGPSTSTLKNICQKLNIKYSKEAYKLWSKIEFEQISTVSANLRLHRFKTKNLFECFSLLFTGGTEQFYQIQNTINEAFRDKLIHTGKMSQREIDRTFLSSTVSNEHLSFISKFLNCRIAIFKESCLSRFGKWNSESDDILTMVLSYVNGFYSIVLNL